MAKTVAGVFDRFLLAEDAIQELKRAGFSQDDISIVTADRRSDAAASSDDTGKDLVAGAGAGAAIGGFAGLMLGLAALALPGVGPVLAAGPIAAALGSAGIGVAAGGFIGALTGMNIPEDDAGYYAETVRNGGAVVIVNAEDTNASEALNILNRSGAHDAEFQGGGDPAHDSHSSEPRAPQVSLSGARIYEAGLEMNPRKSRFED